MEAPRPNSHAFLNHRVTEGTESMDLNAITGRIIGCAIEVHRNLGPGLLESSYKACMAHEFNLVELQYDTEKPLPVIYKGIKVDAGYRLDFLVERTVVVELKCVERIDPVCDAQILTYLKLTRCPVGLLINFKVPQLIQGIRRFRI